MRKVKELKNSVLVEDESSGYMFYVPTEVYEAGDESVFIDNGIPYSLSFDLIIQQTVDAMKVQRHLYRMGIHTLEDVLANRKKVNDVLKQYISTDVLINAIKGG